MITDERPGQKATTDFVAVLRMQYRPGLLASFLVSTGLDLGPFAKLAPLDVFSC
jgi:hypothetical protein